MNLHQKSRKGSSRPQEDLEREEKLYKSAILRNQKMRQKIDQ